MLMIAFLAALWLARRRAARFQFSADKISDASIFALFLGVIGARVTFILQDLPYFLKYPQELWSLKFRGLTSFGGIIFGLFAYAIFALRQKRSLRDVLDVVSPPALLGHAIGRVGCLLNGCCYGFPCTDGTGFCVKVDQSPYLHQPAQLYDSLMNVGALFVLLGIERRGLSRGQTFALFLVLHGITRFIYEYWRAGTVQQVNMGLASSTYWGTLPITQAQVAAVAMIAIGGFLYLFFQRTGYIKQEVPVAS